MSGLSAARAAAVDERFAEFAEGDGTPPSPGIAWGVTIGGELVHAGGLGSLRDGADAPPGPDCAFRIASMTKSFIAAAVLLLRDEGRLALDDPIAQHVPELAELRGPSEDAPAITVRALLAMGSGLPTDDPWADRLEDLSDQDFTALLRGPATVAWPAGVAFEYSNYGYAMLGRLVTNTSGRDFHELVAERILEPLGLTSTAFSADSLDPARLASGYHRVDERWELQPEQRPGAFSAIGGLYSSVSDIAIWICGFCDAWPPRAGAGASHPLSRATRREMQQIATTIPPALLRDGAGRLRVVAGGYCLGLVSQEDVVTGRAISHSGGYPGFGSHMRWHPATGIGVVALANGRYAPVWQPARDALELLVADGAVRRRRIEPALALERARDAVERLLAGWDDGIAERFAPNLELDDPLDRRRVELEGLRERHGRLTRDGEIECDTPYRGHWWLAGEHGGRVHVRIALTPELPPRLQTIELESVADPTPAVLAAARAVVKAISAEGDLPATLSCADAARTEIGATIREAAAQLAPCELGGAIRGDGGDEAVFLAEAPAGRFELTISLDASSRLVGVAITPVDRPAVLR